MSRALSIIKDYLCHSANTVFGMYQQPFNREWDGMLRRILEAGKLLNISDHTITFHCGGDVFEVWTSNRWFSFAHLYRLNGEYIAEHLQARPRFSTMRHLHGIATLVTPVTIDTFYSLVGQQGGSND
ncbi:hypothetical protein GHV37_20380 [Citrobacter koseri]|uniref:hypothetical protein n=1 Tax=Citrobacter koseri TaxID=545 RepID=UPI0019086ECF|nr:hypothetical protein [Citrobacter koseri]MBJ9236996.1 hypothetical protein [Citrobacter koseri]